MKNIKNIKIKLPRISFPETWKDKIGGRFRKMKERSKAAMQSDEMMSLAQKLKLHRSKKQMRVITIASAALILASAGFIYTRVRVFHNYRLLSSVERSDDAATQYVPLGNRTLKCNPNGVTCVDGSNHVQWNVTFTMQKPITDVCGSTVAVGDQGGKSIYIFNKDGQVGRFETEYTLTKVRVASQGVVAAVLEDGEITWVNVYDSQGSIIASAKTSMNESGYPLDVDISSNGQKMAISYLGMDNKNVKTTIAFYNFSSVGRSQSDYLVNSVDYSASVVPQIKFLDGDYAVALRDDGLTFFGGKQVPEQKTEITFEQEIISTFHNDAYIGVVTLSDEETPVHKYKMQIYRKNGTRCGSGYFDLAYKDITISDDEIIMYSDTQIELYSVSGKKKASVVYDKQILDMVKLTGLRKYQITTADSTDKIRIR